MMNENKLRRLLRTGKPSCATRLSSTWPFMTELVGRSGNFDYVEFLGEYAPFSQLDLENLARAAELHDMGTMIKLDFQHRGYAAQRAISSGFQAINFTDHRTADDVRESVRMTMPETPEDGGCFGYPNRRYISCTPYIDQMAHAARLREVVRCFMIEKKQALDNIEAICQVPGVDMVQFGPSDFSMSCGHDKRDHLAACRAAERQMIEVALRYGVQPRCEIHCAQDAAYYIALGVKHFCLGDETDTLRKFLSGEGGAMRALADTLE
ncbi:MAG: aldolase/citrate lyase family protein [Clostridia bacterium]